MNEISRTKVFIAELLTFLLIFGCPVAYWFLFSFLVVDPFFGGMNARLQGGQVILAMVAVLVIIVGGFVSVFFISIAIMRLFLTRKEVEAVVTKEVKPAREGWQLSRNLVLHAEFDRAMGSYYLKLVDLLW